MVSNLKPEFDFIIVNIKECQDLDLTRYLFQTVITPLLELSTILGFYNLFPEIYDTIFVLLGGMIDPEMTSAILSIFTTISRKTDFLRTDWVFDLICIISDENFLGYVSENGLCLELFNLYSCFLLKEIEEPEEGSYENMMNFYIDFVSNCEKIGEDESEMIWSVTRNLLSHVPENCGENLGVLVDAIFDLFTYNMKNVYIQELIIQIGGLFEVEETHLDQILYCCSENLCTDDDDLKVAIRLFVQPFVSETDDGNLGEVIRSLMEIFDEDADE